MSATKITTGLATQARVVVAAPTVTLTLNGTAKQLTSQISATVQDLAGNVQSGTLYYSSSDPSIATVSTSGLITATGHPGRCTLEVSTPSFGNTIAKFCADGTPWNKVYALVEVQVVTGVTAMDFAFSVTLGGDGVYTITQIVYPGSTYNGTVTYKAYFAGGVIVATITGAGTATFRGGGSFYLIGTDPAGTPWFRQHFTIIDPSAPFPQRSKQFAIGDTGGTSG